MDKDPGTPPVNLKLARGVRNPERPGIISLTPDHSLESIIATEEMNRALAPFSAELPAAAVVSECGYLGHPPRQELEPVELQELPPVG
ncbi:unnamed protein product [marine sediment metagenome]|uniref:Uncharacterized protein n=1 Tax=marine sediment metagenome TaxID=412755 RepID=X1FNE0_9ZZZZ